jgi:hypothetical protein
VTLVSLAQKRISLARRLVSEHHCWHGATIGGYADVARHLLFLTRTAGLSLALDHASTSDQPESRILLGHVALQLHEAGSLGGLNPPSVDDVRRDAETADLVAYMRLSATVVAILEQHVAAARDVVGRVPEPRPNGGPSRGSASESTK